MASRLIPLLALTLAICAQGFKLPARSALPKRDFFDFAGNLLYTSPERPEVFLEIDVGDNMVPVVLDFRSADLLVAGTIQDPSQFKDTGETVLLVFPYLERVTVTTAPVITGTVTIAEDSAELAFIHDPDEDLGFQNNFPWSPAQGVLGLGPTSNSSTVQTLHSRYSPMDTLFIKSPQSAFFTILFVGIYESDPSLTDPFFSGFFTVGETLDLVKIFSDVGGLNTSAFPPLGTITSQPPIHLDPSQYTFNVDLIDVTSDPGGSVSNQKALFDTRSNISYVPANIVSIVLGSAPGASQDSSTGMYTLPCDTEVTMRIVIGGIVIDIDPATVVVEVPGTDICVSGFQVLEPSHAPPEVEVIFGTNFLANIYLLMGYNSVHGQTLSDPIIKILALTDPQDAHDLFVATRSGQQSSSSSAWTSWPSASPAANSAQSAPAGAAPAGAAERLAGNLDVQNTGSNGDDLNLPSGSLSDKLKHCLPAIILGLVALIILLVGFAIYAVVSRRRRSGAKESAYRNIHHAEVADNSRTLYGHEEDSMGRYSDPYNDKL